MFEWRALIWLIIEVWAKPTTDSCGPYYNVGPFVSQLNLQFCTIIEIGQGYCSLFVEFREDPTSGDLLQNKVAEVFLGTCECSTIRSWEFCSVPLKKARPYECSLDDGSRLNSSEVARVHRRLCDPTMMVDENSFCDCNKPFGQRTLYPVEGFLTCYRAPLPRSICTTHSVCGVYQCGAKSLSNLALIKCTPLCMGGQPFCEEIGPVTSRPPIVTSFWSRWTYTGSSNEYMDISEAICLENGTHAPAFDCLGPGQFCCPPQAVCECQVSTTMSEMKVTRFILYDHVLKDLDSNSLKDKGPSTASVEDDALDFFRRLTQATSTSTQNIMKKNWTQPTTSPVTERAKYERKRHVWKSPWEYKRYEERSIFDNNDSYYFEEEYNL